jgi:ketosteroid isomerase-like protein
MPGHELVRRLYHLMNAGDVAAAAELLHPDAEWIPDSRVGQEPARGRENIMRFFVDTAEPFDSFHVEPEDLWETGDRVLVFVRVTGRGERGGAPFEIRIAHLWTVRNGLLMRGEGYGDRGEALEVAGVRPPAT